MEGCRNVAIVGGRGAGSGMRYRLLDNTRYPGWFNSSRGIHCAEADRGLPGVLIHGRVDFLVLGESALCLLRVDQLALVRHLEHTAAAWDQRDPARDVKRPAVKDMLRQTGGALVIPSGCAELDLHRWGGLVAAHGNAPLRSRGTGMPGVHPRCGAPSIDADNGTSQRSAHETLRRP